MIPYSTQSLNQKDLQGLVRVWRSGWLTTGPMIARFEAAVAKLVKAKYAAAVSSGTAALHLACLAAGIGPGDEVIVPTYSFAATANCVLFCGGKPVLADIDEQTLCLDVNQVEKKINSQTRAIIGVDFGGKPANWSQLKRLAGKHKLVLIDDAAHSFGAEYQGRPIGGWADLTCFSFHPVKTITTGEGGMIMTNNKRLHQLILSLRSHGIVKKANRRKPWFYQMKYLGYNYRLTDIQSALGLSQLKRVKRFISKRRRLASRYGKRLADLDNLLLPKADPDSAWHLYPIRIDFKKLKKTRQALFGLMSKNGIQLQVHYIPIHCHPYYRRCFGYKRGDFPVAETVYDQEVSLPLYPDLTYKQQDKVINLIHKFIA